MRWFMPCNIKRFDIESHFALSEEIVWKASRKYSVGDLVYLLSAPVSQIRYRCQVCNESIPEHVVKVDAPYAYRPGSASKLYIKLKMEFVFPDGLLPYETLIANGLGTVQAQAQMPEKLIEYISDVEDSLMKQS